MNLGIAKLALLAVGCGHFGANVFGRADDERIQITRNALHRPDPAVVGAEDVHLDLLRQWVRKGVPPETYPLAWPKRGLTIPVPPYPERCVMDGTGAWTRVRYPEGMVRRFGVDLTVCWLRV